MRRRELLKAAFGAAMGAVGATALTERVAAAKGGPPGLARGGIVSSGGMYIIGESSPEVFLYPPLLHDVNPLYSVSHVSNVTESVSRVAQRADRPFTDDEIERKFGWWEGNTSFEAPYEVTISDDRRTFTMRSIGQSDD